MSERNNKPIAQFRKGAISAAVWANEEQRDGKTRTRFSIKIQKRFRNKKDGTWETTDFYFSEELAVLRSIVDQVAALVAEKEPKGAKETVPIQE